MLRTLVVLLLLVALAFGQNYPRIGTLEGQFSSNLATNIYFCINGELLQGSASQFMIVNANLTNNGKTATGNFYQAGISNCDTAAFSISTTDEGFTGTYTCNRIHGTFQWTGKKVSAFRPTDDQCALLYLNDNFTLEGRWTDSNGYNLDICFKTSTSTDIYTVHASYDTKNSGAYYYPNTGFLAGFHFLSGRVIKGTWYEDYDGGAWLVFIRNTGEVVIWKWTGLIGHKGATFIDQIQYNEPDYHSVTIWNGPVSTTNAQCDRSRNLNAFVLDNLQSVYPYNDNGLYYFLDTLISDPKYENPNDPLENYLSEGNNAVSLFFSFSLSILVLLFC